MSFQTHCIQTCILTRSPGASVPPKFEVHVPLHALSSAALSRGDVNKSSPALA